MRILCIRHPGGGHAGVFGARAQATGDALDHWTPATGEPSPASPESYDGPSCSAAG